MAHQVPFMIKENYLKTKEYPNEYSDKDKYLYCTDISCYSLQTIYHKGSHNFREGESIYTSVK